MPPGHPFFLCVNYRHMHCTDITLGKSCSTPWACSTIRYTDECSSQPHACIVMLKHIYPGLWFPHFWPGVNLRRACLVSFLYGGLSLASCMIYLYYSFYLFYLYFLSLSVLLAPVLFALPLMECHYFLTSRLVLSTEPEYVLSSLETLHTHAPNKY